MKKFLIALAVFLVLCVPAFADNEVYFAPAPFTVRGSQDPANLTFSSDSDVYFFVLGNGNVVAISDTSGTAFSVSGKSAGNSNINQTRYTSTSYPEGYYIGTAIGLDSDHMPSGYTFSPDLSVLPVSTTPAQISALFTQYLNSISNPGVSSSFNLPRGNVVYFQVSSESDVNFTSYMETLSFIINGQSATYGPWGDTGQRYGPAAALPTSGTTFPLLSQDPIHWNKDPSQNILGQTKIGRKTVHCIAGQWYCFYNPNANHVEGGDPYQATVGATVNFKGSFSQIKVYPVSQKLSVVDGDLYSGSDDDFSSYYDGTLNENGTVSWTNQDGNIESPSAGGQNFQDGPQSADSILEQIKITLSTVVSELQTLFTFGYEAIQSLVGLMRDFVSVFSGLYTWLPAPVYSALISAVVVAIVIGVFKVFL